MIFSLFRKNPAEKQARSLYRTIVEQARNPYFYSTLGVADTVEGRFELLTAHMYVPLRRLKGQGPEANAFAQTLFDVFFTNMDDSLRELGVGDMSIGRKIRTMAESFYGRVGAYEKSFESENKSDLTDAIARNIYEDAENPNASALARYLRGAVDHFETLPLEEIMRGASSFPVPQDEPDNDHQKTKQKP